MDSPPILYIEDEPDYQVLVSGILAEAGLQTEVADTGDQGLDWLSRRKPSLLLLDVNLPDTSGYTLCSRIRQEEAWAEIPVIMLTVRRRHNEWLEGFSNGADDYLSKPFNPPELVERVQSILNGKPDRRLSLNDPEHLLVERRSPVIVPLLKSSSRNTKPRSFTASGVSRIIPPWRMISRRPPSHWPLRNSISIPGNAPSSRGCIPSLKTKCAFTGGAASRAAR